MHNKFGVEVFGVDYLQLMSIDDKKSTREEILGTITRTLKNLAKELDVLIIILSQLKRDVKQGHVPTLNRLRGSGQIEEAVDVALLIYRPEEFGEEFIDISEGKYFRKSIFSQYIAKSCHFFFSPLVSLIVWMIELRATFKIWMAPLKPAVIKCFPS